MNRELWIIMGAGFVVGAVTLLLISGAAKITEFSPPSSTGIQCVSIEGTGLYCWPKIMNDEVQRWFDREEKE